ncbi:hypothetical protein [Streptomyces sp. NPDC090021]|uniref:hypothetical protein n=1 Tax=Streptomyces sp. NPDC090021 TaxID=3365919 RepID=UPI00381470B9
MKCVGNAVAVFVALVAVAFGAAEFGAGDTVNSASAETTAGVATTPLRSLNWD